MCWYDWHGRWTHGRPVPVRLESCGWQEPRGTGPWVTGDHEAVLWEEGQPVGERVGLLWFGVGVGF